MRERDLLIDNLNSEKPCPFITKLYHTFSDSECLYFVMEYIRGGTLENFLISNARNLSDELIKFIAAQLVLVLECLQ